MGNHYFKVPCEYCGIFIASNRMSWHLQHCSKAKEAKEKPRMEELKKKPIEFMTIREAKESGRWKEFIEAVKNNR